MVVDLGPDLAKITMEDTHWTTEGFGHCTGDFLHKYFTFHFKIYPAKARLVNDLCMSL